MSIETNENEYGLFNESRQNFALSTYIKYHNFFLDFNNKQSNKLNIICLNIQSLRGNKLVKLLKFCNFIKKEMSKYILLL